MAHLAARCTCALSAARPPLATKRAALLVPQRRVRGTVVLAAAARPPPATESGGSGGGGTSSCTSAASRAAARQQRLRQQAQDARLELQQRAVSTWGRGLDEQTSTQVEAVAAELLGAGMTRAAVVRLLDSQPNLAAVDPAALQGKLASVRAFVRGVKRKRAAALSKLCYAAARAVAAQRSDASVAATCVALAELFSAAASNSPAQPAADTRAAVLELVGQDALGDLFAQLDGTQLQSLFQALHSNLGWTPQQAAAALLGLGLRQEQPTATNPQPGDAAFTLCAEFGAAVLTDQPAARAALLRTSGQHVEAVGELLRERGVEGSQLACLTQQSCAHWAASSTADAQAALQALEAAQLPSNLATLLWLCCDAAATEPAFLDTLHQMQEAGVRPQQLQLFGAMLATAPSNVNPKLFAGSMALLHALLGGDWQAAAGAAAEHPRLLQLGNRAPPKLLATCQQLGQTDLEPETRLALVRAAQDSSGHIAHSFGASLGMLSRLLGGWRAAAEAVLADGSLLRLPNDAAMRRCAAGLSTAGLDQAQLLRLAKAAANHHGQAECLAAISESLYGGDWRAAALKVLQDQQLLTHASVDRLQLALRTLHSLGMQVANERGRERVLQYVKGDLAGAQNWRVTVPAGTPAEERRAAAVAAMEAVGFRASGGRAAQVLGQVTDGSASGFSMVHADLRTWQ